MDKATVPVGQRAKNVKRYKKPRKPQNGKPPKDCQLLNILRNKIDKVIDISLLDNEEDVISISIGLNA